MASPLSERATEKMRVPSLTEPCPRVRFVAYLVAMTHLPSSGSCRLPRPKTLLISALLILSTAPTLAGCGSRDAAAEGVEVSGTIETGADVDNMVGGIEQMELVSQPKRMRKYVGSEKRRPTSDLGDAEITVQDASGATVGLGRVQGNAVTVLTTIADGAMPWLACSFEFTVDDVPVGERLTYLLGPRWQGGPLPGQAAAKAAPADFRVGPSHAAEGSGDSPGYFLG